MANTTTRTSDAYKGRYMQLVCVQKMDVANNKSVIEWTLSSIGGEVNYYSTGPTSVYINGTCVYYKDRVNYTAEVFPAAKGSVSGKIEVAHNEDGTKGISVLMNTVVYYGSSKAYSGWWELDPIPQGAKIQTAPSSFTNASLPTITYTNPLQSNASYLAICIADSAGHNGYTDYKTLNKTGTSYTFTATDMVALNNKVASISGGSGKKLDVMFVIKTTANGKDYYDGWSSSYQMVETNDTKPTVTMALAVSNPSTFPSSLANTYIQGKSSVKATITGKGKYGASISSYSLNVGGVTKNSSANVITSDAITKSGNISVIGKATDSRGFPGETTQTISVTEYSKPLIKPIGSESSILCYRSDGNGKRVGNSSSVWIKAKRSYYNLGGKNQCALQWRYRLSKEAWNDNTHKWADLISKTTTTTDEYNALVSGEFLLNESYAVQIKAVDDLGEYDIKDLEIPTQDVALHLGAGGKNVSIGEYCDYSEDYTFKSAWKTIFEKGAEGTLINKYAADVLVFAKECQAGLTPFVTRATSVNLPPKGRYDYSAGIVHRRSDTQINVYLADYYTGEIATNTYLDDDGIGWIGWRYITLSPSIDDEKWIALNAFTNYRRKHGFVTVSAHSKGNVTLTQDAYTVIGTLPVGYRPSVTIPIVYHAQGGSIETQAGFVNPSGTIELYTELTGKNYWAFTVTYPI